MIDPIFKTETKVTFGPVRLAYTHLINKYKFPEEEGDGKYSCVVIVPNSEKKTLEALKKAEANAFNQGLASKWNGKKPVRYDSPLRDGDDKDIADSIILSAKSNRRPNVVNRQLEPIVDEEEVYSGIWAFVSVSFYPYMSNGNKGVAVAIDSVMKHKDGERMSGGGSNAESDFAGVPADDYDDEGL